ncbi:MAG: ABC transporter substrate-binding protein [Herbinix sp.]|nr:ABC transporter substrate-binding protein [Herbinix sp.]
MNTKFTKGMLALLLTFVLVFSAVGCSKKDDTKEPDTTPTTAPTQEPDEDDTTDVVEVVADVPANRYDATVTPRTGNNETSPLVVSIGTLDGKFNPFFATSTYDVEVYERSHIGLLHYNKLGAPEAGIDAPSVAYDYTQEISADNSTSTYTFVLKNKLTFSDGQPITAKDVLFSMYVLSDPMYDGSSTFYTMNIQGINEYRLQTSADILKTVDAIIEAGITAGDDGSMVINPADGVTAEQQEKFWSYLDEAGTGFAQEIIDYVNLNYPSYIPDYFAPYTADQVAADPDMQAAFGMVMWGFGSLDADGAFTDSLDNKYDLATDTVDAKIYWDNILGSYGYDLSDAGINVEKAGELSIQDYIKQHIFLQKDRLLAELRVLQALPPEQWNLKTALKENL